MIDIHSHILPGVDDGSNSISMTLEMLRNAQKENTHKIIATPHFCRGYGEVEYEKIIELCKDINNLAKEEDIDVDIEYGQEIFYSESIINDYKNNLIGTLAKSRYILFELPLHSEIENNIFEDIYELQIMGLKPILAHPERYKFMKNDPSLVNKFIKEGVLFQVNSGSIEGAFGKKAQKTANIFLKSGIYNFIGSDAHDNKTRMTGVQEGTRLASLKNRVYRKLFEESANKLIQDENIEFIGDVVKKRKFYIFR